jgi:hypothetical protein
MVADAGVGIEDAERQAAPCEVVPRREAGLAGADDDGVDLLDRILAVHGTPLVDWVGGDQRIAGRRCRR